MPNFSRYASGVLGVCLIISLIGAKAFSKCTIIFAFLLFVSVSNLGVSFTQNDHVSFILFENWLKIISLSMWSKYPNSIRTESVKKKHLELSEKIWLCVKKYLIKLLSNFSSIRISLVIINDFKAISRIVFFRFVEIIK